MEQSFIDLFRSAQLAVEHCRIKASEMVVIFTDSQKNPVIGDALYAASVASGAETIFISMPTRSGILVDPPPPIVSALVEADMVFDAVSKGWIYAPSLTRILGAGTRVLQVLTPEAGLIARPPDPACIQRATQSRKLLEGSNEFRVTSDLGTDITFHRGDRPVWTSDGVADQPGEFDEMGTGCSAFAPIETIGDGVLYAAGSVFLPMDQFYVTERPIRVEIEGGRIVHIERDHEMARTVADWLAASNDPNAYVVSHVGYGTDHRATFVATDPVAAESVLGGIHVAFGANALVIFKGENISMSHMDFVLSSANLDLDGKRVIEKGAFTAESGISNQEALAPPPSD